MQVEGRRHLLAPRAMISGESAAIVSTIGALILLDIVLGHYTSFFIGDSAIKYLAIRSITQHWSSAAISYPLSFLDPLGRYTLPMTAWLGGREYAGYSLPYEYLTAAFYAVFGGAGLVFPSILGASLLLFAQVQLALLLGVKSRVGLVFATVAASPILFYSLNVWEHSLGVALELAGVSLLLFDVRRAPAPSASASGSVRVWLAGACMLAATMMRRELLVVSLVAVAVIAITQPRRDLWLRLAPVLITLLAPLALILYLHPVPLSLGITHESPGRAGIGIDGLHVSRQHHLLWLAAGGYATAVFAVATLCVGYVTLFRRRLLVVTVCIAGIVVGLAYFVNLLATAAPWNSNPLAFSQVAALGVWSILVLGPDNCWRRVHTVLYLLCGLGASAVLLAASDYGGGQWGPRYILFVFPLLTLLAIACYERLQLRAVGAGERRLLMYTFATLMGLSVLTQVLSLTLYAQVKADISALQATVAAIPQSVVVAPYASHNIVTNLAPLNGQKMILFAATNRDQDRLFHLLATHGMHKLAFICPRRKPTCRWPEESGWTRVFVRTTGLVRIATYRFEARV